MDDDIFQRRMDGYDSLTQEERLEKYREEVCRIETEILKITGDPIADPLWKTLTREDSMEIVDHLLDNRRYVLSKMFALHCSDAEVKRIEALDARLLQLSRNLFERTAKMYHAVLDMPQDERDDDISVEGTLRYVGDMARDILQLEDDAFYGSDFKRMILILSYLETEYRGDLPILRCQPEWDPGKKGKSSLTDKYLGMEDQWMEDGTTWAEGWLRHPKLDHIVMCYATHALVTHAKYCVPDYMRLNSFEVKVEVVVRQDAEQDGSRMWWWTRCGLQQFKDKFLHEAEHRPSGMGRGEFVYKRGVAYFDVEEMDEADKRMQADRAKFGASVRMDISPEEFERIFPGDRMERLPDCSKDESLIDAFLEALWKDVKNR